MKPKYTAGPIRHLQANGEYRIYITEWDDIRCNGKMLFHIQSANPDPWAEKIVALLNKDYECGSTLTTSEKPQRDGSSVDGPKK